jgi:hypothetical protein
LLRFKAIFLKLWHEAPEAQCIAEDEDAGERHGARRDHR